MVRTVLARSLSMADAPTAPLTAHRSRTSAGAPSLEAAIETDPTLALRPGAGLVLVEVVSAARLRTASIRQLVAWVSVLLVPLLADLQAESSGRSTANGTLFSVPLWVVLVLTLLRTNTASGVRKSARRRNVGRRSTKDVAGAMFDDDDESTRSCDRRYVTGRHELD